MWLGTFLDSEGPRRGEGCFLLWSKHHLCWKGEKGISLQPEQCQWNVSQTEHARSPGSPVWLQDDEIFGHDKECSQANMWVLIKVSFYIVYIFTFTSWDVPRAEWRWEACTALSMLLISIWQDTLCFVHRLFLTPTERTATFISSKLEISSQAEAPHMVGVCTVWAWQWLLAQNGSVLKKIRKSRAWEKEGLLCLI